MESLRETEDDGDLRDAAPALAGVVLCGGRSVRMGVDKASIDVGGVTLLGRAVSRLATACDPVLVAPGGLTLDAAARRAVTDAIPGAGPLAGVVAALRASPHPLLAVVAVDMPWLDPDLLSLLASRIGTGDVALCETDRGIEPLHAVYARSALGAAEMALERPDRSMRGLIGTLRSVCVTAAEWSAAGFAGRFADNVNTPADLEQLRMELRRPGK